MNLSRIFRSRWSALWWAGGVIWFAYDVASATGPERSPTTAQTDAVGETVNAADLAILANAAGS